MSLTIITPTIGTKYLKDCIKSIQKQTNQNFIYYIVVDGQKYNESVQKILNEFGTLPTNYKIISLNENTGANGWCGHRIYISMAFLTNSDYIMFLDEDNTFEPTHVELMLKKIKDKKLDWTFSLRNIIDKENMHICKDKCESLGNLHHIWNNPNDHLVDTNCYCIKRELLIKYSNDIHTIDRPKNGIGFDKMIYKCLSKKDTQNNYIYKFETTGQYSVNYRVGSNENGVKADFFLKGNSMMQERDKSIYVFHLDPTWTKLALSTNEFDYESKRYLYEDGNKTLLYQLSKEYKLINGYQNVIPSNSICLFIVLDLRLFPTQILERTDIKKICYLLEGPNSWHKDNYNYDALNKYFNKIITYWTPLLELNNPKIEYFPFTFRVDISNKYHKEMINKKRKYDKSIGLILANRSNNEEYEINGIKLKRLDFLRKQIVLALNNITVHGQGWNELVGLDNSKKIIVENIKNRLEDTVNINKFYNRFNFALIVENCNGENYVSEKIYDAWIAGCIPIYLGNTIDKFIPSDCYINILDFDNFEDINTYINNLTQNDIDNYYNSIHKNIENILDQVSPNEFSKKIIDIINNPIQINTGLDILKLTEKVIEKPTEKPTKVLINKQLDFSNNSNVKNSILG